MCLALNKMKPKVAKKKTGFGWKVFETDGTGALYGVCYGVNTGREVGTWLKAENDPNAAKWDIGFHIYARRNDAVGLHHAAPIVGYQERSMVLRRVKYRKATYEGLGDGGWNDNARVVVAQEMFILGKRRKVYRTSERLPLPSWLRSEFG